MALGPFMSKKGSVHEGTAQNGTAQTMTGIPFRRFWLYWLYLETGDMKFAD